MFRYSWNKLIIIGLLAISLLITIPSNTFAKKDKIWESRDNRIEWWRDAKFGLFIHFGLYAIPAGEWDGKKVGWSEWLMNSAQIRVNEYETLLNQFNPTEFDADEWVSIAKNAGMKYLVVTTKHHDGFALFDSKVSDYDIQSTPFNRDIISELAEACKKADIKLGLYYSIMDWHHPDYLPRRDWEDRSSESANYEKYLEYMKAQLDELLENYEGVSILWFDGGWEGDWSQKRGVDLYRYLVEKNPGLIVNNRVGREEWMSSAALSVGPAGDFSTPELHLPAQGVEGYDWETCMTMNDSWGYNKDDNNWKSYPDMLKQLITIASTGGNFLLNVGPNEKGKIPEESVERLTKIGEWLKVNSESIYGTEGINLGKQAWGRVTQKILENGDTRLYLHIFDWPADNKLVVENLQNDILEVFLLSDRESKIEFSVNDNSGSTLNLNFPTPDLVASVIVMDLEGALEANEQIFSFPESGSVELPLNESILDGMMVKLLEVTENGEKWSLPESSMRWNVNFSEPGEYSISLIYSSQDWAAGEVFKVTVAGQVLEDRIKASPEVKSFNLGNVNISETGLQELILSPGLTKPFTIPQPEKIVIKSEF
jgi:alpha-L-fucosidase